MARSQRHYYDAECVRPCAERRHGQVGSGDGQDAVLGTVAGHLRDIFGTCNFLDTKKKKKSRNLAVSELFLVETTELESVTSRV